MTASATVTFSAIAALASSLGLFILAMLERRVSRLEDHFFQKERHHV